MSKTESKAVTKTDLTVWKHRLNRQEPIAKDFGTGESFENGGILYVFPFFETARMGQKTRYSATDDLFCDSYGLIESRGRWKPGRALLSYPIPSELEFPQRHGQVGTSVQATSVPRACWSPKSGAGNRTI